VDGAAALCGIGAFGHQPSRAVTRSAQSGMRAAPLPSPGASMTDELINGCSADNLPADDPLMQLIDPPARVYFWPAETKRNRAQAQVVVVDEPLPEGEDEFSELIDTKFAPIKEAVQAGGTGLLITPHIRIASAAIAAAQLKGWNAQREPDPVRA